VATAAIETRGLTKYYGPVVGLENLSLEVGQGEVFGFLGANGAGKTTTIRMLLDLVRPTSGTASILGFDCHRQGLEARRRIGYLPGEMPIYPELTGGRYLRFLASLGDRRPAPARIEFLLRRFDVSDLDLNRRMRDYSHGMKRKLGLIQALMTEPRVLILDEPTSGLDPLMIEAFSETIDELARSGHTTIFLSAHRPGSRRSARGRAHAERTAGRRTETHDGAVLDARQRRYPRVTRRDADHARGGALGPRRTGSARRDHSAARTSPHR
jgi:beta-exotoxin I transport system ATP-binding protein